MKEGELGISMSEKIKGLLDKGAPLLSLTILAAATVGEEKSVDASIPTVEPTPTVEPFPSPSPEFVLSMEKSAQERIDAQFEGLGIYDPKFIGGVLTDATGQNSFALFESSLPDKTTNQDLSFFMITGVGQKNKIEWVRGLVLSEAYPQDGNILTFASATFEAETQIFEIHDPYLRTNVQTGEIEIATDGMTWIPLLGSPYTYNEVETRVGGKRILTARALPTPTAKPTPTPEPTPVPTPTEIPIYTGKLVDAAIYRLLQNPEIKQLNRELLDINMYLVLFGQFLTLVRQAEIPGTNITEHIWGFSLRGQDYRFRTYNVACQLPGTAAYPGYSETLGGQFESLEIGQNYNVAFFGLLESPTENELRLASNDCKTVLRGLRTDSEDMERLRKFFATRDTAGFAVDENGIMDLTKVITVIQVDKPK